MRHRFACSLAVVALALSLSTLGANAQAPALPTVTARALPAETVQDFGGCSFACASSWTTRVSSHLPARGATRYDARCLGDGNAKTAWGSRGKGEWLELVFQGKNTPGWEAPLRGLRIIDGYAKSPAVWKSNARVKTLRLDVNGQPRALVALRDTSQVQAATFPDIVIHKGDRLRLTIVDVYPGTSSADTCISEIVVDGAH